MNNFFPRETLELDLVFWLKALHPSKPNARDYFRFFPDVDVTEMISCVTKLVEKEIVAETAIRKEDDHIYLSLEGMFLTEKGHTYACKLAKCERD